MAVHSKSSSSVLASTLYGYDAASRLAAVGDGTNSVGYGYLANSSLVGDIAFERNGEMVMTTAKQYDNLNRLTSTASAGGAPVSSFNYQYNSANQRTAATNVDSSYWLYQYDALGQVVSGKKYWADGTPVAGQQFTYNFDDIGNRQSTASGGDGSGANLRSANYTANNLNEYTSRDVPGYATVLGSANSNATVTVNLQRAYRHGNYFQDELAVNNSSSALWLTLTNLAVLNNGTNADIVATNTGNKLLPQTPETFGYDADGNLTNSGRWTIVWDAENRAISFVSLSNSPAASRKKIDCAYDFQGRRIQKVVSMWNGSAYAAQSTNRFVYDGWNLIGILDGNDNLLYSFQWGTDLSGSLQDAGGIGGLLSITVTNAGTYFYSFDGNGNVAALVNAANGTIAGQWEYDPFLGISRASGALASINPFLGSTKYYDSEIRLYYYSYRYYDPSVGRWPSRDPLEEDGGLNIYTMVGNDAIDEADMLGQWKLYNKMNGQAFDHTYSLQAMADYILKKTQAPESIFIIANRITDLLPDLGLHIHADSINVPSKPSLCCVDFDGDVTGVGADISKIASLDADGEIRLKDCKTYELKDLETDGNAHIKIFVGESKSATEHVKSAELKGGGSLDMELGPTYGAEVDKSVVMGVHVKTTFSISFSLSVGTIDLNKSKNFITEGLLQLYPTLDYTAK